MGKKNDKKKKKSRKSNKSKKSAKKSKKSKKSGKKSRKNKKKSRKSKKSSKKSRKNRKNNKKGDERTSSRAIDTKCVAQLTLSMRRWKDVVTNFQRQSKRITDNQNKGDGKSGKQSVFAPIASRLVSTGGGNSSALTCGGSSTSDGAVALTKLAKDLADCEKLVNDSCHTDNFPTANTTLIDECTTLTDKFVEEATKCLVKSKDESTAAEGCTCWTDPAELTKKAAALSANKDALGNVKTKLNSLTGTRRTRVIRAPATTCAGVMDLVSTLLALVEEFPSAPTLLDLAKDIVDSPDIECSDDEKEALKAQVAEVESAEEAVSAELDVALADLTVSVGSTPSSAALASVAAAEETTAATATTRTRRRIFRNFNQ